jgi:hypothetical protein
VPSQSPIGVESVVLSVKTSSRAAFHLFHILQGGLCWTGQCHEICLALLRSPLIAHSQIVSPRIFTISERNKTRRKMRHLLVVAKSLLFVSVDPINASRIVASPILAGSGIQSELMTTDALHACNDCHISVIQFGLRMAWLYRF